MGPPVVGSCINLFRAEWLTTLMWLISALGDGVVIPVVIVVISAALFYKKDKVFAFTLALAPLAGQIVKSLLKNFYQIPRPGVFGCQVLTTAVDRYSFPSGHTIFYTIFFGLIAYYCVKHFTDLRAKIGLIVAALLILLVGYSRIYLGAHWYLDILGGYVVGGAILLVSILVYKYIQGVKNV